MAPQTASEVIEAGLYLEPAFNPNTLTIPILLSILTYHRVPYPSQYNKGRLIQLFLEEIQPRAAQFKQERARAELARKKPSNEGFTDGITGDALAPVHERAPRRSSRRASRTPDVAPQPVPTFENGKPRRSSAGPVARTAVRSYGLPQPTLPEQSEPDDSFEFNVKVSRKPKGDATSSRPPRQAAEDGDGNPWSDHNVFQSGPDSSSPAREPSSKPARKSAAPKAVSGYSPPPVPPLRRQSSGRSSFSAPPQHPPSAPAPSVPAVQRRSLLQPIAYREAQPRDAPRASLPSIVTPQLEIADENQLHEEIEDAPSEETEPEEDDVEAQDHYEDRLVPLNDVEDVEEVQPEGVESEDQSEGSSAEEDDHNAVISSKLAEMNHTPSRKSQGRSKVVASTSPSASSRGSQPSLFRRFVVTLVLLFAATSLIEYKTTSAWIGYCDAHRDTNLRVNELQATRALKQLEAAECRLRIADSLNMSHPLQNELSCLPFPIKNYFDAEKCTPCPKHATCAPDTVVCHPSFILSPHYIARIPFVSAIMDGIPGIGSVAFPPKCIPDRAQQKKIEGLGRGIEEWLAFTRGEKLCKGVKPLAEILGGEAKAYGYSREHLRSAAHAMNKKQNRDTDTIDEMFEKAVANLHASEWIVTSTDENGEVYHAATRAKLDFACNVKVHMIDFWERARRTVFTIIGTMLILLYGRYRVASNAVQARRVAMLVQEALDILQEQEMAYYSDPVSNPDDFIVPAHLRDLILKDEHSPQARQNVWERVRRVVEGNANVRTNLQEVHGEDTTVWKWIGSSGPRDKRRVSFVDRSEVGSHMK